MTGLETALRYLLAVAAYRASDEIRERTGVRTRLDYLADEVHPGAPPPGWGWDYRRSRA